MKFRMFRRAPTTSTAPATSPLRRTLRVAVPLLVVLLLGGTAAAYTLATADNGSGVSVSRAPQPVVDGNRLVDRRTGRTFVPQGVSWSSLEYACAQGWGLSSLDTLAVPDPEREQAEAIAAWGANTVRLPLNQDCWLGTRDAPVSDEYDERTVADYRAAVLSFVDALNHEGLVVVLDLHSRKRIGSDSAGSLAMPDPESLAFWSSVAGAYRDHPSVMFDAFHAPSSRTDAAGNVVFDLTWPCWRDGGCRAPVDDDQTPTNGRVTYPAQGMARVVQAIRQAGARQPVLLSGIDGGNDLTRWWELAPQDDQLVASFHVADDSACATPACWDATLLPLSGSVPVVGGDVRTERPGAGYLRDYLAWADAHRVGSLFWVWSDHATDPTSLVSGPHHRPTAFGALARAHLTD